MSVPKTIFEPGENPFEDILDYALRHGTDPSEISPVEYVPNVEDYPTVEEFEEAMREHIRIENHRNSLAAQSVPS
jgi:hypothetical protein